MNGSLGVRNPRTGQIDYAIAPPSPDDLDALAHRMRDAQRAWCGRGLEARLDALRLWRGELARERDAVIDALTIDTGRHGVSVIELDLVLGHLDRWCRPTVLTNVSHAMRVMTEETFGPIIPIMPFEGDDQAVHLANDTIYGLSAAVFPGDEERALAIAARLDAGAISINDAALTAVIHEGEKNAFRFSGMGESRMGAASLHRFLRRKTYLIKKNATANPWWFSELNQ